MSTPSGPILYELLTGRPPFTGETPLATVIQMLDNEPVPVTSLQPNVPRDLETICLKCLRKEPRQRYGSTLELAEDLQCFLARRTHPGATGELRGETGATGCAATRRRRDSSPPACLRLWWR